MNEIPTISNVLLIDDDPICNMISKIMIENTHFSDHVEVFTNARKALQDLKESADPALPQIIFLDINMPVMDGWGFLEEFEKLPRASQQCKIFILSSSNNDEDINKSKKFKSVFDYLTKPLTETQLAAIMDNVYHKQLVGKRK